MAEISPNFSYQVGGSLPVNSPTYIYRQADEQFYQGLKAGEFCYVLNSRQMGKSSLRVRTMQRLQADNIVCVSIDLTAIGTSDITPEEWYAGIIDSIVSSLNLYDNFDLDEWWNKNQRLSNVRRWNKFIEAILLPSIDQKIVIFVDEIDSILRLNFNVDDFFSSIRACYNQRAEKQAFNRLSFALLGVATPNDLMNIQHQSTPFNIGQAIELTGFEFEEAKPLALGFIQKSAKPEIVLQEILNWTGGQPFLTQKVCQLVRLSDEIIPEGEEKDWVGKLVRSRIIENWEAQDEPEHLRTIRDRLLWGSNTLDQKICKRSEELLQTYSKIIKYGSITALDQPHYLELRLTGIVVQKQKKLEICSRIYATIFNLDWINKILNYNQENNFNYKLNTQSLTVDIFNIEKLASLARYHLDNNPIQGLGLALHAGRRLQSLLSENTSISNYPTLKPIYVLQKIIHKLINKNQTISGHKAPVWSVNFTQDGQRLITAGDDGSIQVWDLSGLLIHQWQGEPGGFRSVNYNPILEQIVTVNLQGFVRIWNISGQVLNEFNSGCHAFFSPGDSIGPVVQYSSNGQLIAIAGNNKKLKLWDLSGTLVREWYTGMDLVSSICFSQDDNYISTTGRDGRTQLWNHLGRPLAEFKDIPSLIWSAKISPNQKYVSTANGKGFVHLWNLSGERILSWQANQGSPVFDLSFSPDSECIATSGNNGVVRLWDLSGRQLTKLEHQGDRIWSVGFSPNGKFIATTENSGQVHLWQINSLDELLTLGQDWLDSYSMKVH